MKATAQVFWVDGEWPGRLGIVLRPRGGDWLADEVAAWRSVGIDEVVSLLEPHEIQELDLDLEPEACRGHGVQFRAFPVQDRDVPTSRRAAVHLALALLQSLHRGRSVAVHCRQGIGRSASLVALILAASGVDPERAFAAVREARGRPVPDTEDQRAWVNAVAQAWNGGAAQEPAGVREPGDEC